MLLLLIGLVWLNIPQEPQAVGAPTIGNGKVNAKFLNDISVKQAEMMLKYGTHIQLTKQGKVQIRNQEVADLDGITVPAGVEIHVWESEIGSGYQITYEHDGLLDSWAFGDDPREVADRTFTDNLIDDPELP